MVVAQLRDEVVGMKQMIIGLQSQNKPHKANTHIPMSVEEASAYLKMPMATLYMKLGNGSIPATKGKEDKPVIGFIAHMDTAEDASGDNIRAKVVEYNGGDILLNEEKQIWRTVCT